MKIFEGFKRFAQPYGDDDYDEYEDDEYMDDYEEEPARRSRRRSAPVSAPPVEDDDIDEEDFGFDMPSSAPAASAASAPASGFNGRVVSMHSGPKQKIVMFRPTSFDDTSKAAKELLANKAVILNLENVDKAMGRRIVDFLSGCVYALNGAPRKVAQHAFVFCPSTMEFEGDLETLQAEVESYI